GPAGRLRLVEEAIARAGRGDQLGPLERLAESPGLPSYAASRIRSLRRDGVTPQAAASFLKKSDGEQAAPILARVYRQYLDALARTGAVDDEGLIELAAETPVPPSDAIRQLLIDLPGLPCELEARLLRRLAASAERVVLALGGPAEEAFAADAFDANRLPAAQAQTHQWLEALKLEDAACERAALACGLAAPPGVAATAAALFDENADPAHDSTGVAVVAGATEHDTARRVAGRVKRLLSEGAGHAAIVIATPCVDADAPRLLEALREHGVAAASDAAPRLGAAPVIAATRALVRLARGEWDAESVRAIANRGDFGGLARRPEEPGFASAGAALEWIVRDAPLLAGRAAIVGRVRRLAEVADAAEPSRRRVAAARAALPALDELTASIDWLPTRGAAPLAWFDALAAAMRRLGAPWNATPIDRRAIDTLEGALAESEAIDRLRGRDAPRLDAAALSRRLDAWAARLRLPKEGGDDGRVRIVGLATAATLSIDHLIVFGASESALADDGETPDEATLRFYELVTRPARSVTVAYASLDDAAQPLPPSPLVSDLERVFMPGLLRAGEPPPLAPPDADRAPRSPRDARVRAVVAARAGDGRELASYASARGPALLASLVAIDARRRGDTLGEWEGVLAGAAARAALGERFGPEHAWSASRLERLAECPFRFFAQHVVGAEPTPDPTLDTDARRRGSMMHDALATLHAELAGDRSAAGLSDAELLDRLLAEIAAERDRRGGGGHDATLAAIEALEAQGWAEGFPKQLDRYSSKYAAYDEPLRPAMLEVRFGPSRHADGPEDARSTDEPLRLALPGGGEAIVTGRIDRIDVGRSGDQEVVAVIDYKTGGKQVVRRADVASGRKLQTVLYALAAERLLCEGAVTVDSGYWWLREGGFQGPKGDGARNRADVAMTAESRDGTLTPSREWRETVDAVLVRVEQLIATARGGAFAVFNPDEKCGERCDYRTVCRVGQARALGKLPPAGETPPHGEATGADE
ncbi:MAG: PD-(D/E)XK nuclease family protein, partial [Planctomycetota bacterium]